MRKIIFLLVVWLYGASAYCQSYWNPVPSGTGKDLLCISFGNAATGYIGGRDSLLLKTTDGGESWQPQALNGVSFPASADEITDVHFLSADTGYITVGVYDQPTYTGSVYRTFDGGSTWTPVDAGNTAAFRTFFFSAGEGFVVGSAFFAGYVISRIEGGNPTDYDVFSFAPEQYFRAIDFRNKNIGVVAGDTSLVCITVNGGADWDTTHIAAGARVNSLRFLNDSTILAATDNTLTPVMISRDTGRTWAAEMNLATFDYPAMKVVTTSAKDSFIIAGASTTQPGKGTLYWHQNGNNMIYTADHPLYGAAMRDDSIAYAVGDQGLIVTNAAAPLSVSGVSLLQNALKVFPNPASRTCTVSLPVKHTLRVYDLCGKEVLRLDKPALQHRVDLGGYAPGVYVFALHTPQGRLHTKVLLR